MLQIITWRLLVGVKLWCLVEWSMAHIWALPKYVIYIYISIQTIYIVGDGLTIDKIMTQYCLFIPLFKNPIKRVVHYNILRIIKVCHDIVVHIGLFVYICRVYWNSKLKWIYFKKYFRFRYQAASSKVISLYQRYFYLDDNMLAWILTDLHIKRFN